MDINQIIVWARTRHLPIRENAQLPARHFSQARVVAVCQEPSSREPKPSPQTISLKGGDPAAGSPTATLLRLHPSH